METHRKKDVERSEKGISTQGLPGNARLLALVLFVALPIMASAQFNHTTNAGKITITLYTGSGGAVAIPSMINGLPVTSIGTGAFRYCSNLTSVTIPDSVTLLENYSFQYCTGLTNLVIGQGVTTIGFSVFSGCSSLRSVTLPDSVTSIGNTVFGYCTSLARVTLSTNLARIGDYQFYHCEALANLTVPSSVTNVGGQAFWRCFSLTGVFFQGNAPVFGSSVFYEDNNATLYYLPGATGWGPSVDGRPTVLLAQLYLLSLYGGTGGGAYTNMQPVTITASAPPTGQVFDRWVGDTQYVAIVTASPTTVTMPAQAVTLTATYRDVYYTLTVNGGSGSGSYTYLQSVAITANAPSAGQAFDRWTGDTQHVASATSSVTTVTMPAQAVALAALYKDELSTQTISFGSLPRKRVGDVPFTLGATASSGLPVSYTSSNPDVAVVSGDTVTIMRIGATTITARQAGDAAYLPAADVSQILHVDGRPGEVVAWGKIWNGSTLVDVTVPSGLTNVTAVAAGNFPVVVVKDDGTVVTWGYNGYGQTNVPVGLSNVTAVAAGLYHTVALKTNGTVVAWGSNGAGQTTIPAGLSNVTAIAAGGMFTVALMGDGAVAAWGYNNQGQTTIPVGLSNVTAVAAGDEFVIALKNDGTLTAWGHNAFGQATVPTGLSNVTAIAAGQYHALALKNDGTVMAWGFNNQGQSAVPDGLSNVTAIAAGGYHSLALRRDGIVVPWGGNGTSVPAGLSNVTAIATGGAKTVVIVSTARAGQPDSDNDGIPDSWEQLYFGGSTNANPVAICSNGVNTVREAYVAGLNPSDPQSTLRISFCGVPTSEKVISWNTVSGRVYDVYWTTNLLNGFQCLESNLLWTRTSFTNSTVVPSGYYKIGVRLENE